jgi:glycosyltransferase involved in cell wall biosynthesis
VKVSIVTISYNQAEFLERCIQSVALQDCEGTLEYILVDPGSADGSREIIENCRSHIDIVGYSQDSGPADGLNKGFRVASGEILAFLNADDVFLPGAVRSAQSFFSARPDVDVVSGHGLAIDRNDRILRRIYSDRFSARGYVYGASVLVQQATFFRAEAFRAAGGFNVQNRCAWDGELFLAMAIRGAKFAVTNEYWSGFRLHPSGITGSNRLSELQAAYHREMFRKIMGRDKTFPDAVMGLGLRALKHLAHPVRAIERVRYGAVRNLGTESALGKASRFHGPQSLSGPNN